MVFPRPRFQLITWRLGSPEVPIHCWDAFCAAYEPTSGLTHLLSLPAAETLRLLSQGLMTDEQIAVALAKRVPFPSDESATASVNAILTELELYRFVCRS